MKLSKIALSTIVALSIGTAAYGETVTCHGVKIDLETETLKSLSLNLVKYYSDPNLNMETIKLMQDKMKELKKERLETEIAVGNAGLDSIPEGDYICTTTGYVHNGQDMIFGGRELVNYTKDEIKMTEILDDDTLRDNTSSHIFRDINDKGMGVYMSDYNYRRFINTPDDTHMEFFGRENGEIIFQSVSREIVKKLDGSTQENVKFETRNCQPRK